MKKKKTIVQAFSLIVAISFMPWSGNAHDIIRDIPKTLDYSRPDFNDEPAGASNIPSAPDCFIPDDSDYPKKPDCAINVHKSSSIPDINIQIEQLNIWPPFYGPITLRPSGYEKEYYQEESHPVEIERRTWERGGYTSDLNEALEGLYEAFEDPSREGSDCCYRGILYPYLSYKQDPPEEALARLQSYVSQYTVRERQRMLLWIAEDERLAALFQTNALKFFNGAHKPLEDFTSKLPGERANFMELILHYENDAAINWVFDSLNSACGGELSCLLKKYCVLGRVLGRSSYSYRPDPENMLDYVLDYERYRTFLDKVITDKVNKEKWDDQELVDAGDLKDWGEELCGVEDSG